MFQTEKRVRGTKPPKTELEGRQGTEEFDNPNEAVGDDLLQYFADNKTERWVKKRLGRHESSRA